jgi:biotin synthase
MEDSDLSALCERAGMYSDVTEIRLSAIDGTPAEDLVHFVSVASSSARKGTVISIDFADLDLDVCRDLRKAGASVAYHSYRIGEGVDTDIKPERRMETVRNLCDAGFRVVAGTEPVGPEHSAKEIVDCFFSTLGTDVKHAEINPREAVPDTRLGDRGTISSARLAQIRGVLTLASAWNSQSAAGTGLAEPYIQGKNVAVAHYDMKDWRAQTEAARRRLFNAGFDRILRTDGSAASLSIAYLRQTGAL